MNKNNQVLSTNTYPQQEDENEKEKELTYEFEVHGRYINVVHNSCNLFGPYNSFRRLAIWLVEWRLWEYIILLVTVTNTATLLAYDYSDRNSKSIRNKVLNVHEIVFTLIYLFEVILKVVAYGFFSHTRGYLRNGWNYVDLIIVIIGILDIPFNKVYGMKLFRVLKILKFSYTSKGMKSLLTPLLASILQLPDVLLSMFVMLLAFGIIETFQFQGSYYYRCRMTPEPVNGTWEIDRSVPRFCSAYGYGDYECPANRYCGHPNMYGLSMKTENVSDMIETNYDAVGFDTIIKAVLTNIQISTHEKWSDMMYKTCDTVDSIFSRIFFPVIIYVCSFFMINFIVAVIVDSLLKNRESDDSKVVNNDQSKLQIIPVDFPAEEQSKVTTNRRRLTAQNTAKALFSLTRSHTLRPMIRHEIENENTERIMNPQNKTTTIEFKLKDKKVKATRIMNILVVIIVLANILTMCFDRVGISDKEILVFDILDTIFFAFFFLEMIFKIYICNLLNYLFSDSNNIVDLIINILGIIEVALTYSSVSLDYVTRGIIVIFRVTRVAKLINKWTILKEMLTFIWITLGDIINFMILLALFVFIYAVIGMELFAGKVKFNSEDMLDLEKGKVPGYNFDSLGRALVASYTLVIADNWSSYMYPYTRVSYTVGLVYFYTGIYVLNVFLVNVFLAIILQNFYVDETKKEWEENERKDKEYAEKLRRSKTSNLQYKNREKTLLTALKIFKAIISLNKICKERKKKTRKLLAGKSLSLFSNESVFRVKIFQIVESKIYFWLSYIFSVGITVVLTFQTPLYNPKGTMATVMNILSVCLAVFFTLGIIFGSIAYGVLFNGVNSFLRSPWNVIDTISTLALVLQFSLGNPSHCVLGKVLMILVTIRVLRIATIKDGFKLSIQAIIKGFPKMIRTLGVGMLFFFILSVIGITFFKGIMHYCDMTNMTSLISKADLNVYSCMNYGGEWKNGDISFDNIFMSLMILFELMTSGSWWQLVTELSKNYEVNTSLHGDGNYNTAFFVVICTIIGFLYIRAIITGLISHVFNTEKEEIQGVTNLKYTQRKWVNFSKVIFKASPIRKVSLLYLIVVSTWLSFLYRLPNLYPSCF